VRFRESRGRYRLSIVDGDNQTVNHDKILFILNGHPFKNLEFVSNLSSNDINRIDVVFTPFMYGDLKYNGLLSLHTHSIFTLNSSNFGNPIPVFNNPLHNEQFLFSKDRDPLFQDISPSLLWIPETTIYKGEPLKITIPKFRFRGDYIVKIAGFTDNGEPVNQSFSFKVE